MNTFNPVPPAVADGVYLRACLAPLEPWLGRPDVTDIMVNHPGEVWIETIGGMLERQARPDLTADILDRLARQIPALSHQGINRESPLLSAVLPDGSRIQIIAPPATRGPAAMAIRRHLAPELRLSDYLKEGAFEETGADQYPSVVGADRIFRQQIARLDFAGALATAVASRMNILVSGGTSTGKTTFLNALMREISSNERVILIEDTPELAVTHDNSIGLVAVRGELGEAKVSANDLVAASLRMRPDRIILGELRGPEAFAFLRAVNSGHPGSMTTIHADGPEEAIEQLVLLALQTGTALRRADVLHYARNTIDVYVHLGRRAGRRTVERVWSPRSRLDREGQNGKRTR